jgi:xylan 1,4-beta-xylosidase
VSYNKGGNVWLKLERLEHQLSGFFSRDGKNWTSVGAPVSAVALDKAQPNFNSWVGTSLGLFAEDGPVDFDLFVCKDGFSALPAIGSSNQYGTHKVKRGDDWVVTNFSPYGGWLMISGVDFGAAGEAKAIEIMAAATQKGELKVLVDDLENGRQIAGVPVKPGQLSGRAPLQIKDLSGQHDLFIRFPAGISQEIFIRSIRLLRTGK